MIDPVSRPVESARLDANGAGAPKPAAISLCRQVARQFVGWMQSGFVTGSMQRKMRLHAADAVAIACAASRVDVLANQVLQALGTGSGGGVCHVFGSTERLAPPMAAFANSALMHMLDFDDIHDLARLHPTSVCLPAALTAAECVAAPFSRVLDATVLANELMCRLGMMCQPQGTGAGSDWFLTQLFGYFGAALAAALVLDLSEDQLVSALGFAYMQAAGGKEAGFGLGGTGRAIYPAFAAMGGMQAALLARAGLAGPESALDGTANLFSIYLGGRPEAWPLETLLAPSGFHFEATQIKPWPCCRLSHPYVSAAMALRERWDGQPVRSIMIGVNASADKLCQPLTGRRRPRTLQDAKYSIPYMTALAFAKGKVDLCGLVPGVLADQEVYALADLIEIDASLPDNPGHPPAVLRLETIPGQVLTEHAGNFDLSPDGVRLKFEACMSYAGRADSASRLWRLLVEDAASVSLDELFD
jgi:2-methylcitrate dehydratase PrpD